MSQKKIVKSLGGGVQLRYTKGSQPVVFIRYSAFGKTYVESVGPSMTAAQAGVAGPKKRDITVERARGILRERKIEIRDAKRDGTAWLPPKDRKQQKVDERIAADKAREALLIDNAFETFEDQCAADYSDGGRAIRSRLRREKNPRTGRKSALVTWLEGNCLFYLDEITEANIRAYYLDRMNRTGPFEGWGAVSIRTPEQEIMTLSAVYTHHADLGHALCNPCHRPRTRRRDSPLAPYRPVHKKMMLSDEALEAILNADPRAEGSGRGRWKPGRRLVSPGARALFNLVYYTASRPESEPCQLRHGDVELAAKGEWGRVVFRGFNAKGTKTGDESRWVPLHPQAAEALKEVMLPEPMGAERRAEWRETPIFRRRGSGEPWNTSSYRSAWQNALESAAEAHPEVEGVHLRDLRSIAKTKMLAAGAAEGSVDRILGHRGGVRGSYLISEFEWMREAMEALTLKTCHPTCHLTASEAKSS